MDNLQEPTVWHREVCSVLCASLNGRGVCRRMNTCPCTAESLCCSPETTTTLLMAIPQYKIKSLESGERKKWKQKMANFKWYIFYHNLRKRTEQSQQVLIFSLLFFLFFLNKWSVLVLGTRLLPPCGSDINEKTDGWVLWFQLAACCVTCN